MAMPYSANVTPQSTCLSLPQTGPLSPPPSQPSIPTRMEPPAVAATTKGLCPGLIVPPNRECVLAIRLLTDLADGDTAPLSPRLMSPTQHRLDILDLQGKPVMKAHVVRPWPRDTAFKQRPPVVTLVTVNPNGQEERLTFCRAGGEGSGRRSMYIYDKDDVLFGCIKRDSTRPCYVLTSSHGRLQLLFEGDFIRHTVTVFSDGRELLSHAEPCSMATDPSSHYYQARVAEGVDVGLIVSGLLSIDSMETM